MKEKLISKAKEARKNSYSPYSEFSVGAAILTESGGIYTGCNIENINFTNTEHAEQLALHKAVSCGHRNFEAIAIDLSGEAVPPCGLCRQSLSEFCSSDLKVFVSEGNDYTLGQLLPSSMEDIDNE